jgi:hypothetical protein
MGLFMCTDNDWRPDDFIVINHSECPTKYDEQREPWKEAARMFAHVLIW